MADSESNPIAPVAEIDEVDEECNEDIEGRRLYAALVRLLRHPEPCRFSHVSASASTGLAELPADAFLVGCSMLDDGLDTRQPVSSLDARSRHARCGNVRAV